jgi:C-terminal peptidase prc
MMTMYIRRTIAVAFWAVASLGGTRSLADGGLEVYAIGSEQRVVDSLEASTPEVAAPPGLNILDSAYAAVLAKAYPQPDASALAAAAVAAVGEEFRRRTGKELSAARCRSLSEAAARAGRFEGVLCELQTESPQELDSDRLIEAGLAGMLSGPQPPAWLVGKEEAAQFQEMILARKEPKLEPGVVGLDVGNWPTVNVSPAGPAQDAGLRNGDVMVRVNGRDANSVRSLAEIKNLLSGRAGSTVTLTVRRESREREFLVHRAGLDAMSVRAETLQPGILRLSVPRLEGSGIAQRVERLLADPRAASRALLLDLRDNPGGRLEEANAIANLFLDGKLLEILECRAGRRIAFRAAAGSLPLRVSVLVNRHTGSSAEILAMALRDNAAAVIVGEPTAGMLFGKHFEPLKDGRMLVIRIAPRILSPIGKDYGPGGVTPDLRVPDDKKGHDNILDQALRHALNPGDT